MHPSHKKQIDKTQYKSKFGLNAESAPLEKMTLGMDLFLETLISPGKALLFTPGLRHVRRSPSFRNERILSH